MSQIAQINNLSLVRTATERLIGRNERLPGIAVLYGPAGYGKTTSALAIANENRSYFVQMRSAWKCKAMLEKVLLEMGAKPHGTIPQMLDQVCEQLATSGRMLMIDEFDYCVRNDSMIELVRDIYEGIIKPGESQSGGSGNGAGASVAVLSAEQVKVCELLGVAQDDFKQTLSAPA
ncbi:MAG: ATP-binding protein [Betaproteobacteria bacterium]